MYESVHRSWHNKLKQIIQFTLASDEYMHIRSALIFLSRIEDVFPLTVSIGQELTVDLLKLEKEEIKRVDLQIMAKSLSTMFKRRSPSWIADIPLTIFDKTPASTSDSASISQKGKISDTSLSSSKNFKNSGVVPALISISAPIPSAKATTTQSGPKKESTFTVKSKTVSSGTFEIENGYELGEEPEDRLSEQIALPAKTAFVAVDSTLASSTLSTMAQPLPPPSQQIPGFFIFP